MLRTPHPHREPSYLITTFKRIVNRSIRQFPVSLCHSQHPPTTHNVNAVCNLLGCPHLPPLLLCVEAAFYRLPYVVTEAVFIFRVAAPSYPPAHSYSGNLLQHFHNFQHLYLFAVMCLRCCWYMLCPTHTHTPTHVNVSRHASSGNTGLYGK